MKDQLEYLEGKFHKYTERLQFLKDEEETSDYMIYPEVVEWSQNEKNKASQEIHHLEATINFIKEKGTCDHKDEHGNRLDYYVGEISFNYCPKCNQITC